MGAEISQIQGWRHRPAAGTCILGVACRGRHSHGSPRSQPGRGEAAQAEWMVRAWPSWPRRDSTGLKATVPEACMCLLKNHPLLS